MDVESLTINKQSWDEIAHRFFGRNPLPEYGPLAPSEEELNLFGDVTNLKVLEIGCGSGHSLQYMDQKNAGELWGLDLSNKQVDAAKILLRNCNSPVKLFESPMEDNPGLPTNYFDVVFSIYALGWTTNLDKTLTNVNKYLKQGGIFIFSWEHPIYNRVDNINGTLTFNKSYHEEGSYYHEAWTHPAIMQQYRMSTYINTLINNGFKIERVVEDVCLSDEDIQRHSNRWYSYEKAKALPTAVIIKSTKL
ncbi:class I SAM-dependent methyltransferase [Cytobacillus sp. IB215665]|uniref:class I SAM-dependent methyltransferase n=1 Tax=Cytobacillus sp. IB215665 TaxID=3097357 RepID=UPI002A10EFFB|nr:methyltransferase domain-containing protein [Cytobacillus sp. IB215665]MDX8365497.1 methyltransferase domain-containing protein [Cytobacillus sp. IB215665]